MARKFSFRGESLLRTRRRREQSARTKLTVAQTRVAEVHSRLEYVRATLGELNTAAMQAVKDAAGAQDLAVFRLCVRNCSQAIAQRAAELAAAEAELGARRQELAEAIKDRKALDVLKDKLQSKHRRMARRIASAERDDLHAARPAHSPE